MPVLAAYPNAVPSFTTKADDIDTIFADHINVLQAEVAAIASTLGTLPASTYGTVKARIAAVESSAADIAARFDSGGLLPEAGVTNLVDDLAALNASISSLGSLSTQLTAMQTPWTAYTPTVTASPTNPTWSAANRFGRYKLIGKTLILNININGAPTSAGTGLYAFSLPSGMTSSTATGTGLFQSGSVIYTDSSFLDHVGGVYLNPGNPSFQVVLDGGGHLSNSTGIVQLFASLAIEVE